MPATGSFVWYELMTPDPAASEAFYTKVVGWTCASAGMPGNDYWLLSAAGTQVAGVMSMPEQAAASGAPAAWRGFIGVPDTDKATASATAAGATLHYGPEDIPHVGRFASLTDPQHAGFLLFEPAPGSEAARLSQQTRGAIGWHELHAANWEEAWTFYADQFGWTKTEAHDMGPVGIYQLFAAGDSFGGMMTRMDASRPPFWLYYFNVDSIDAAQARLQEAGGTVVNGPNQVPGGTWILQGIDPQGIMFALSGPK